VKKPDLIFKNKGETMKYDTVIGNSLAEFDAAVNKRLLSGWKLQGGVSVSVYVQSGGDIGEVSVFYAQAMIKE
jgi:hypothetical protein